MFFRTDAIVRALMFFALVSGLTNCNSSETENGRSIQKGMAFPTWIAAQEVLKRWYCEEQAGKKARANR